ncbi:single-stranded DNA-binding protein [Natribacillus halophilus]|uniref:Single-stranded DNA-binding protein n=1 Tax=Natribacillus halophilus TaxID=549003 RepID=A0A1G8KQ25_9BACI|nr:single-stranded DNA-binding protein [Natribacillus halophilus]SDI45489.1 single-strand binding protein [Natribacillus halophilus]
MLNQVTLIGRLTKDPELMFTNSGVAYVKLFLAVQRPFKNNEGVNDVDFIPCIIWRKRAENTVNYCRKGSLVSVTGRIQIRQFTNKDDERVFMTEVVGEDLRFLKLESNRRRQDQEEAKTEQPS